MPDIVRQPGARLTGQVDPRLAKRFYPGPLANLRRSYGAFHAFDKAHTVALTEAGLVPRDAACAILSGLREMEAEGIEAARDSMGGGRHSGEAYLTGKLGARVAGWINLGRSSGDLDAVAWRYNLRARLPEVITEIGRLRASLLDVAGRHVETLLPAYSIGQQAQTTTLAHTLLSWEAPFARDAARALALHEEAGGSPAGSAIMTGSTFPISRERTAELLGFDSVHANTRDAVVNLDTLAERFDAGSVITPELLREKGVVRGAARPIKVLARGDISKKLTVRAHKFSGKAAEKIAAAGGAAEPLAIGG